jgi:hypothetical protein
MTLQEFGQNVSDSGILTPEENNLFFKKFSGVEVTSDVWNLSVRRANKRTLLRCCRFGVYGIQWILKTDTLDHGLCVTFSKPVFFHGVRFLGNKGQEYYVKFEVFSQSVETNLRPQRGSSGIFGFDVMLPVPLKVEANVAVHLRATITGCGVLGLISAGINGRKKVETNGITVNFFDTPCRHSTVTSVENGQFDQIIFCEY